MASLWISAPGEEVGIRAVVSAAGFRPALATAGVAKALSFTLASVRFHFASAAERQGRGLEPLHLHPQEWEEIY